MPKQPVTGFRSLPEHELLHEYVLDAPADPWTGRLDYIALGKRSNLLCYFTDEATGKKYRLSTFWTNQFRPYSEGPCFREEAPGGCYEIRTMISKNGVPRFDSARKLEPC